MTQLELFSIQNRHCHWGYIPTKYARCTRQAQVMLCCWQAGVNMWIEVISKVNFQGVTFEETSLLKPIYCIADIGSITARVKVGFAKSD